jgi:hypothetical protein
MGFFYNLVMVWKVSYMSENKTGVVFEGKDYAGFLEF